MKIDGRLLANDILQDLKQTIIQNHLSPHLAIILVGDNPASVSYANRKKIKAQDIGAKATIVNYELSITNEQLLDKINELNNDSTISGIIVQRPLPAHIDSEKVNQAVIPSKDIDAFHKDSLFENPLVKAVFVILAYVHQQSSHTASLQNWLKEKSIVIIGKGETGGGPLITSFKNQGISPTIIDRATTHPQDTMYTADIIISAVGKKDIVKKENIKKGAVLISIGQYKDTDGKFSGDYTESEIASLASFYTPTPGGVGPLTVACLLENLVQATR